MCIRDRPNTTQYATQRVHELGYKMFWIPFFFANGYLWADEMGFDAVAYQPNHFFKSPYDKDDAGLLGTRQIDRAAQAANSVSYTHLATSGGKIWALMPLPSSRTIISMKLENLVAKALLATGGSNALPDSQVTVRRVSKWSLTIELPATI